MGEGSEWLWSALVAAGLAGLGYMGRQVFDTWQAIRTSQQIKRSRLLELLALLRAGETAYRIQSEQRDALATSIMNRLGRSDSGGYDALFAESFAGMTNVEKERHLIIRAITVHTIRPLNEALLSWLQSDRDFRVYDGRESTRRQLAAFLRDLEAHLLLWRAKFEAWIPDRAERSLVYLADEKRHGIGFPNRGTELTSQVLFGRPAP